MNDSSHGVVENIFLGYYYRATEHVFDEMTSGVYGDVSAEEMRTIWELNFRAAKRIQQSGIPPTAASKSWPSRERDVAEVLDTVSFLANSANRVDFDFTEKQLAKSFETRHETFQTNRELISREVSTHLLLALGATGLGVILGHGVALIICSLAIIMGISGVFLLLRQGHEKHRKLLARGMLLAAGYILLLEILIFIQKFNHISLNK